MKSAVLALGILFGLVALAFLTAAAMESGDRHGADILLAGIGLPFLVAALLSGWVWRRLAAREKAGTRVPVEAAQPRRWIRRMDAVLWGVAGLVLIGMTVTILRMPSYQSPGNVAPTATREPAAPAPSSAAIGTGDPGLEQASDPFTAADLETFLARLEADTETPFDSNVHQGMRYVGTYAYSDIPWGLEGERFPFACRRALLQRLAPLWLGRPVGADAPPFIRTGDFRTDTLFRDLPCAEFPADAQVYFARRDSARQLAVWTPVSPAYRIRTTLRRMPEGHVMAHLGLALDPVETADDPKAPFEAGQDPSRAGLFRVSAPGRKDPPSEYRELVFSQDPFSSLGGTPGLEAKEAQAESLLTLELTGFRPGQLARVWVEVTFGVGGKFDTGFRWKAARAELKCRYPGGPDISLATSVRGTGLYTEDAAIYQVEVTDADGDGNPDFLVQGVNLPYRLIFTGPEGSRTVIPLRPWLAEPGGC